MHKNKPLSVVALQVILVMQSFWLDCAAAGSFRFGGFNRAIFPYSIPYHWPNTYLPYVTNFHIITIHRFYRRAFIGRQLFTNDPSPLQMMSNSVRQILAGGMYQSRWRITGTDRDQPAYQTQPLTLQLSNFDSVTSTRTITPSLPERLVQHRESNAAIVEVRTVYVPSSVYFVAGFHTDLWVFYDSRRRRFNTDFYASDIALRQAQLALDYIHAPRWILLDSIAAEDTLYFLTRHFPPDDVNDNNVDLLNPATFTSLTQTHELNQDNPLFRDFLALSNVRRVVRAIEQLQTANGNTCAITQLCIIYNTWGYSAILHISESGTSNDAHH